MEEVRVYSSCEACLSQNMFSRFQVYSPFESAGPQPQSVPFKTVYSRSINDRRSGVADEPILAEWETLDQGVWNVVRALKLLPPEVLEASLAIPFSPQRSLQPTYAITCSQLCDPHLNNLQHRAEHSISLPTSSACVDSSMPGIMMDGDSSRQQHAPAASGKHISE